MKRRKSGFTLVEIIIVVLIICILAAIALPSFVRANRANRRAICSSRLMRIHAAKEELLKDKLVGPNDTPTRGQITKIIGTFPSCPSGGEYIIGSEKDDPKCSFDHEAEMRQNL